MRIVTSSETCESPSNYAQGVVHNAGSECIVIAGHLCACTYIGIAGLTAPEHLLEIEAEGVRD